MGVVGGCSRLVSTYINLNPFKEDDETFYEKSVGPDGIQNPAYLTVEKPVNKFLEVTKVCLHMSNVCPLYL